MKSDDSGKFQSYSFDGYCQPSNVSSAILGFVLLIRKGYFDRLKIGGLPLVEGNHCQADNLRQERDTFKSVAAQYWCQ